MSEEELLRGEWMKDPGLVAEYMALKKEAAGAVVAALEEKLSDEDRARLWQIIEGGPHERGDDLINAEGVM